MLTLSASKLSRDLDVPGAAKLVLKSERGIAVFELIPVLVIVALFLNFIFGFFGVIHTGILNSIASRNYTFETFRHRSNVAFFRDLEDGYNSGPKTRYHETQIRYHGTTGEQRPKGALSWIATVRDIAFIKDQAGLDDDLGSRGEHQSTLANIRPDQRIEDSEGFSPVWIQPTYGICINFECGKP